MPYPSPTLYPGTGRFVEPVITGPPVEELDPDSFGNELYANLGPITELDRNNDLLTFCRALGRMFQTLRDLARDTDSGPGWTSLFDPSRAPAIALLWMAQPAGVKINSSLPEAVQRSRLANNPRVGDGHPDAMKDAIREKLTGTQTILMRERDTSPGHFTVLTLTSETPSTAAVHEAIRSKKPGGLMYDYFTITGATYALYRTTYATYGALDSAFLTYSGILNNAPGT